MKNVDRFDNPINLGDIVAYYGSSIGLIVGVVVKFNPKSYKIKTKKTAPNGKIIEYYYNVTFDSKDLILTSVGMSKVKPEDILNDVEKLRLGLST